ncbi:hypothetical protein QO010_000467 [Caulobacter ginsengisoli]|uniref:Uncharacterized protein n=1 Tax=Caulobacter ginsengisoli TaxID=400775 RepID=A0ABU0INX3_9CAUL|nr:hypothetical protein [Caulobacter ginsengisoli]MDQ0462719.1 hypothetical protein [Caulobacter ginsengisoli]
MFRFPLSRLAPFLSRKRQRFETAVADELLYLREAFGDEALPRGIERAARSYISARRREVIKEAVRRLADTMTPAGETGP